MKMNLFSLLVLSCAVLSANCSDRADIYGGDVIYPTLPIAALYSDNTRCRQDSRLLMENLKNATAWAVQMWDASVKTPVGVYAGNTFQMGDFDECVATLAPVRGQYCLATVTVSHKGSGAQDRIGEVNDPSRSIWEKINYVSDPQMIRRDVIHWALCVPASCTHADVQASIERYLSATPANNSRPTLSVAVDAALCQTNRQEETLSTGAVVYCAIVAVIVLVVLGSTGYDFFCHDEDIKNESNAIGYLLCFSLKKNFPEIAQPESTNHSLDCIYGMRFLSICLITIDHRIGISIAGPIQNYEFIERQYKRFYTIIFLQGDALVDTFFVISGLLVTYILLLTLDKRKINPIFAILLRYFRLTPVYALVIFFYVTMLHRLNDGPMWEFVVGPERDACAQSWWLNLLYINNYVQDDKMCMMQSWYLPCDTHFFIVALFVVMVMHKRPKTGCAILAALTALSVAIPLVITYVTEKAPLLYFYSDFLQSPRTHEVFQSMYSKSHNRASPYFVGMATGFFLYKTRSYKKNYTWLTNAVFVVGVIFCLASILPSIIFYDINWEYDVIQASVYAGFHRLLWAVGICLFMLSIIYSKKSMIGSVLSWSPMISLSKLVYSQYLVHMAFQFAHTSSIRSPQHISVINVSSLAMGDIAWCLVIALGLYLTVEAPIRLIFKRLMSNERQVAPAPNADEFRYTQKICIGP